MYCTITPQQLGANYSQSAAGFVSYLEKENQGIPKQDQALFFNQYEDTLAPETVIADIDSNTAKLKKTEPKFYSITLNPSTYELARLQNTDADLKAYTRAVMRDYVTCFNREIDGKPLQISDIKYYAKIEHQRTFKGSDIQIQENQPYATQILAHKNTIRRIQNGEATGNIPALQHQIDRLERQAPHQQNGKRIVRGMQKPGNQSHVHIIVSRKDASNRYSLSPGSRYKASEVNLHGKNVKRGFDRDAFFKKAESTFDTTFQYQRNYVETYRARKLLLKNPKLYFSTVTGLPTQSRAIAFKMLRASNMPLLPQIPTNKAQLALQAFRRLKRAMEIAVKSSSIGI